MRVARPVSSVTKIHSLGCRTRRRRSRQGDHGVKLLRVAASVELSITQFDREGPAIRCQLKASYEARPSGAGNPLIGRISRNDRGVGPDQLPTTAFAPERVGHAILRGQPLPEDRLPLVGQEPHDREVGELLYGQILHGYVPNQARRQGPELGEQLLPSNDFPLLSIDRTTWLAAAPRGRMSRAVLQRSQIRDLVI